MRCRHCGGLLLQDEPGELVCTACGRRLYDREILFAERLTDAINELTVRDAARELMQGDPVLASRRPGRWDSERAAPRLRSPGKRLLGVWIPREDLDQLEQIAVLTGRKVPDLAREAIHSYVAEVGDQEAVA